MSNDTPILTLVGGWLTVPMEDAPTVVMAAVGAADPSVLTWQTDYRVERDLPGVGFVYASVMRAAIDSPDPWSAYLAVNAAETFKGWFATAEAARAAVEEHIAAYVEAAASPHEHAWVDVTELDAVDRELYCADCGEFKDESR